MDKERKIAEIVRAALKKGDKVLLVPVKGGVRLFRFDRKEILVDGSGFVAVEL